MPLCTSSGHDLLEGASAGLAADATLSTQMYSSYSAAIVQKSETSFADAFDRVVPFIKRGDALGEVELHDAREEVLGAERRHADG